MIFNLNLSVSNILSTSTFQALPAKLRTGSLAIVAASLLINVVTLAHIEVDKRKNENENDANQQDHIKVGDVSVCILVLAVMVVWVIVSFTLNKFNAGDENQRPNYNIYWLQNVVIPLGIAVAGTFMFAKKKAARIVIIEKVRSFCLKIIHNL